MKNYNNVKNISSHFNIKKQNVKQLNGTQTKVQFKWWKIIILWRMYQYILTKIIKTKNN